MADTGAARLPGIPTLRTDDRALAEWAKAVTEHLEVRNGGRGNPAEKTVVQRDLESIQAALTELRAVKTATPAATTATSSTTTEVTPASASTLNADVARVERTLNAALEALRSRIASAEGQIASAGSGQGEPLYRGSFGDMTGPYEVNGGKRWSLQPDVGLSPFGGAAGGNRSGAYSTTVGDVLSSLSHAFYRFETWQGTTATLPQLNGGMKVRLSGNETDSVQLKDLATRVTFLPATVQLRSWSYSVGATPTTVGDTLDALSHVNYSASSWAGSASEPKLNLRLKIRGTTGGPSGGEWALEDLAKTLEFIPAATKLRSWSYTAGATPTTMGDTLDVLSHAFYSTANWLGTGVAPTLNPVLRIGAGATLQSVANRVVNGTEAANLHYTSIINAGSGGSPYTLQNFTDDVAARLILGTSPCILNGDTNIGVAGLTLRTFQARVEQIGREAQQYLVAHEGRLNYLEARELDITRTSTILFQDHEARLNALERA